MKSGPLARFKYPWTSGLNISIPLVDSRFKVSGILTSCSGTAPCFTTKLRLDQKNAIVEGTICMKTVSTLVEWRAEGMLKMTK